MSKITETMTCRTKNAQPPGERPSQLPRKKLKCWDSTTVRPVAMQQSLLEVTTTKEATVTIIIIGTTAIKIIQNRITTTVGTAITTTTNRIVTGTIGTTVGTATTTPTTGPTTHHRTTTVTGTTVTGSTVTGNGLLGKIVVIGGVVHGNGKGGIVTGTEAIAITITPIIIIMNGVARQVDPGVGAAVRTPTPITIVGEAATTPTTPTGVEEEEEEGGGTEVEEEERITTTAEKNG
jgi:hypothetical protein